MRKHTLYIKLTAFVAILAVVCYEGYWMTDIYDTLQSDLQRNIQEAMRASDFEEMAHRVEMLKDEHRGGQMSVSVGANKEHDKALVANEYHEKGDTIDNNENNNGPQLAFDDFSHVLKTEKEVMNVGLNMQRGIHSGLDRLKPVDPQYYDSLLNVRLKNLKLSARRQSMLVHWRDTINSDTLYASNHDIYAAADTFYHVLNIEYDMEYILLVERSIFTLPHQMYAPVIFSITALLIIIVAFGYIINMLKRMWALDEMKSDFTNNITHELKTPIAVAYAATDALLNFNGKSDGEKLKKYLTICQDQLSLLSELVEQILSLSMERRKSIRLNIDDVDVTSVVNKVVSNHKLKTKKPLDVEMHITPGMTVKADMMHFTNIINNLVDNAIKYSTESIHIKIEGYDEGNGHKTIRITDNGIGIDKVHQQYVFEKFYRVPHGNLHAVKGYGLGLHYVKCMTEKMSGRVTLESEIGRGTTFKLQFDD